MCTSINVIIMVMVLLTSGIKKHLCSQNKFCEVLSHINLKKHYISSELYCLSEHHWAQTQLQWMHEAVISGGRGITRPRSCYFHCLFYNFPKHWVAAKLNHTHTLERKRLVHTLKAEERNRQRQPRWSDTTIAPLLFSASLPGYTLFISFLNLFLFIFYSSVYVSTAMLCCRCSPPHSCPRASG